MPERKRCCIDNESSGITEQPVSESRDDHIVRVKFADNRAYEYNCFDEIHADDVVYVGGAKSGCRGMVTAITEKMAVPGFYNVVKLVKIKKD